MRLVCAACRRPMAVKQMGVNVRETRTHDERVYRADLFACPGCGAEVISGFGQNPYIESWQENWAPVITRLVNEETVYVVNNP